MKIVIKIENKMYLFIWWIVVITLSNSERIRAVNVIVTILIKDSSNKLMLRTIMITPW